MCVCVCVCMCVSGVCVFACFKRMKTLHLYPFRYSCHHDCSCDLALIVCLGSPYTAVLFFACDWQEAVGFQSSLSPRVRPTNERRQCRNQASGRNMIQTQYAVIMPSIDSQVLLENRTQLPRSKCSGGDTRDDCYLNSSTVCIS